MENPQIFWSDFFNVSLEVTSNYFNGGELGEVPAVIECLGSRATEFLTNYIKQRDETIEAVKKTC